MDYLTSPKTYILPIVAVGIVIAVYYSGVATSGNIAASSTAVSAVEIVFGIIGALTVAAGLIYASRGIGGFQYASIFAMYLPVTYVLVGILVDIVAQQYRVSAASLTAIIAVIFNKVASSIVTNYMGGTTQKIQELIAQNGDMSTLYTRVYQGCTVPGFENLESILAPQSLVIIFTLFFFFLIDILASGSGQSVAGLGGITAAAVVVQLAFIHTNGCLTGSYYWMNSIVTPIILSILIGGVVGGLGWTANHFISGSNTVTEGFTSVLPKVGSSTSGSSGSDDNQFVCEAYKNGELVTSTITE